jgi:hypothetical protein
MRRQPTTKDCKLQALLNHARNRDEFDGILFLLCDLRLDPGVTGLFLDGVDNFDDVLNIMLVECIQLIPKLGSNGNVYE